MEVGVGRQPGAVPAPVLALALVDHGCDVETVLLSPGRRLAVGTESASPASRKHPRRGEDGDADPVLAITARNQHLSAGAARAAGAAALTAA